MSAETHDAPLNLRRDRACIDDLLWRLDLPEGANLERMADALEAAGLARRGQTSTLPLWVFFTDDEHRVLFVPATGRLQLRVHYTTRRAERVAVALRLAGVVAGALQGVFTW